MSVEVSDNEGERRYEARIDGELAGVLEHRGRGETRGLVHTEVGDSFGGRGVGRALVRFALDDARSHGRRIVPICPFVHRYLLEHPQDLDLVEPRIRRSFQLPDPAA